MNEKESNRRWLIVVAIAVTCIPFFIFLFIGGEITGDEFSPDDFSRRRFNYNKMPLFGVIIRGIKYEDITPVFEQTLYADGFIGKAPKNRNWHLLSDSKSNPLSPDFDARLLTNLFEIRGDGPESFWIQFNNEHPKMATVLWPLIATLARQYLYLDAADLLIKARSLKDDEVEKFTKEVNQIAIAALTKKAELETSNGNYQIAENLYSHILDIEPNADAFNARANIYLELGQDENYHHDIQAAKSLE